MQLCETCFTTVDRQYLFFRFHWIITQIKREIRHFHWVRFGSFFMYFYRAWCTPFTPTITLLSLLLLRKRKPKNRNRGFLVLDKAQVNEDSNNFMPNIRVQWWRRDKLLISVPCDSQSTKIWNESCYVLSKKALSVKTSLTRFKSTLMVRGMQTRPWPWSIMAGAIFCITDNGIVMRQALSYCVAHR